MSPRTPRFSRNAGLAILAAALVVPLCFAWYRQRQLVPGRPAPIEQQLVRTCTMPLAELCAPGPCLSYDAMLSKNGSLTVDEPCRGIAIVTGTCGEHRYVSESGGYGTTTAFFDASNAMVAVIRTADYEAFCESTTNHAQSPGLPACRRTVAQHLCARFPEMPHVDGCAAGDPLCESK